LLQGSLEVFLSKFTNGHTTWAEVLTLLWLPRAQFWFLFSLFLIVLFSLLVYQRRAWWASLLVLGLGVALYLYGGSLPQSIRPWLLTAHFVFFAAGVAFSHIEGFAWRTASWWCLPVLILATGLQWVYHAVWHLHPNFGGEATLLVSMAGIAAVLGVSMVASHHAWLGASWWVSLGRASMAIYLMHVVVCSGVRVLLSKVMGVQNAELHLFAGTVSGLLVPWYVQKNAEKWGLEALFSLPRQWSGSRASAHSPS
jgi:peptidoglycan/LPS O-acetylase OafA/YrhL